MKNTLKLIAPLTVAALLTLYSHAGSAAPAAKPADRPPFARVGDQIISAQDYDNALAVAARNKFYHGKPPEGEMALLQREVGEQVVARALLLREAKRRGLKPDAAEVQKTLREYEQRYAASEQWKAQRAQILPGLTQRLEEDSLYNQIERLARAVPVPDTKAVRTYYAAHPDKFTEPEQLRVSVILLRVEPGAPQSAWDKAYEEAKDIIKRLRGGADFAALARIHSGDTSAEQGGDMGYLHHGMLPDGAETVMDKAKVGEIPDPVRVLEGIAVLRLADRKAARLNSFEAVLARARDLCQRDQSDQALKTLVARLKKETPPQVDASFYLPLATGKNISGQPGTEPGKTRAAGEGARK